MRSSLALRCGALGLALWFCACAGPGARDPLSAGTAKLLLRPGVTTQTEVIEAFGGPNIVTGNAEGVETWTYDRMAYEAHTSSGGANFASGGVATLAGSAVPMVGSAWARSSSATSASRTATLFLYWEQGVLADFKYRTTTY